MSADKTTDSNERMHQRERQVLVDAIEREQKEKAELAKEVAGLRSWFAKHAFVEIWAIISAVAVGMLVLFTLATRANDGQWFWQPKEWERSADYKRGHDNGYQEGKLYQALGTFGTLTLTTDETLPWRPLHAKPSPPPTDLHTFPSDGVTRVYLDDRWHYISDDGTTKRDLGPSDVFPMGEPHRVKRARR